MRADGFENRVKQFLRALRRDPQDLREQPVLAELLTPFVAGLGETVGVDEQSVAGL